MRAELAGWGGCCPRSRPALHCGETGVSSFTPPCPPAQPWSAGQFSAGYSGSLGPCSKVGTGEGCWCIRGGSLWPGCPGLVLRTQGIRVGQARVEGWSVPPMPPSSGLPPRMQKGGGADPLSSGNSQGSGKEAQTKLSPKAGMGRGGETDHGKRGGREGSRNRRCGRREEDARMEHGPGTEGRLGEIQVAGPGLCDPPSAMRRRQGSEQGTVEFDFRSHAHCAACWTGEGQVTPGRGPGTEGEPWSWTGGAGGAASGAPSPVN